MTRLLRGPALLALCAILGPHGAAMAEPVARPPEWRWSIEQKVAMSKRDAPVIVIGRFSLPALPTQQDLLRDGRTFAELRLDIDRVVKGGEHVHGPTIRFVLPVWNVVHGGPAPRDADAVLASQPALEGRFDDRQLDETSYRKQLAAARAVIVRWPGYLRRAVLVPIGIPWESHYRDTDVLVDFGRPYLVMVFDSDLKQNVTLGPDDVDVYSGAVLTFGYALDIYPVTDERAMRALAIPP